MTSSEKASALHEEGYNCAQCTLCSLSAFTGTDDGTAKALAGCLGHGVGAGEICGAVTGAALALGLAFPCTEGRGFSRDRAKRLGEELCSRFKSEFGALRCEELLNMTFPERKCSEYIDRCRALAEELIENERRSSL